MQSVSTAGQLIKMPNVLRPRVFWKEKLQPVLINHFAEWSNLTILKNKAHDFLSFRDFLRILCVPLVPVYLLGFLLVPCGSYSR